MAEDLTGAVKRGPGRPPLVAGQSTATFTVRLPERMHDAVCVEARRQGVDVSTFLRSALQKTLARTT